MINVSTNEKSGQDCNYVYTRHTGMNTSLCKMHSSFHERRHCWNNKHRARILRPKSSWATEGEFSTLFRLVGKWMAERKEGRKEGRTLISERHYLGVVSLNALGVEQWRASTANNGGVCASKV